MCSLFTLVLAKYEAIVCSFSHAVIDGRAVTLNSSLSFSKIKTPMRMRFQSSSSLFSPKKTPFSSTSSSLPKTPIHSLLIAAMSDDEWWRIDLIRSDEDSEGNPNEWWEAGHEHW